MRRWSRSILLLLITCAAVALALTLTRRHSCDLDALMVEDILMPSDWLRVGRVLPPVLPKEGAHDALAVVYANDSDTAQHEVYRYATELSAFLYLRINKQVFFPSGLWYWSEMEGTGDLPLSGDEARILCARSNDPTLRTVGTLCTAVVRYGPDISVFSAPLRPPELSETTFSGIVVGIDHRFESCGD
ncbi:MAG: hypothetical protein A2Z37_05045 [Chloroflexi bacterium RBG_19FT_COMBO_62_14]|nr:MAG: hypothetical protein A2Z37_05045 [Chloroflexi bacterium RBG_19FT_COMBO_62_14]